MTVLADARPTVSAGGTTRCPGCFATGATPAGADAPCARCADADVGVDVLPAGATLLGGRYVVGRPLGQPGGFGVTYFGWDASLARRVAIKELFPRWAVTRDTASGTVRPTSAAVAPAFRAQLDDFLLEAQRAARIEHEHVVKVLDFTQANGTGYIVMPYYAGETLAALRLRRPEGRLPWRDAVALALPIIDALHAVHLAGMVHRDVKPSNVYLAEVGAGAARPILLDFGAARASAESRALTGILSEGYAPPEQYVPDGRGQGPWTDVYAAAATLWELVTGAPLPPAPARYAQPALVPPTRAELPTALLDALGAALQLDRAARTASAELLAASLRRVTDDRTVGAPRRATPGLAARLALLASPRARIAGGIGALLLVGALARSVVRTSSMAPAVTAPDTSFADVATATSAPRAPAPRAPAPPVSAPPTRAAPVPPPRATDAADPRPGRARRLLARGDYAGAHALARAAGASALMEQVRTACQSDSTLAARRGVPIVCPPASTTRSGDSPTDPT